MAIFIGILLLPFALAAWMLRIVLVLGLVVLVMIFTVFGHFFPDLYTHFVNVGMQVATFLDHISI